MYILTIYDPEFVVVVDESLLETVDVTAGLKKEGAILVNTARPKEEIIPHLKDTKENFIQLMHIKYLWKLWEDISRIHHFLQQL